MKLKKLLGAALAAAMAFGLLCAPASAAVSEAALDLLNTQITVDIGASSLDKLAGQAAVSRQHWVAGTDDEGQTTYTLTDAGDRETVSVHRLPLGVTLAAGPDNPWTGKIRAFSDPDGDGVFVQRIERLTLREDGTTAAQVADLDQTGPLVQTEGVAYGLLFGWGRGHDRVTCGLDRWGRGGYRTLTTDCLVDLFGANTLLMLENGGTGAHSYFLLTGEERPADMAAYPLSSLDVFITGHGGHLVSQWALDYVNACSIRGLVPEAVEEGHRYNMQERVTRGEFAAIAVSLYTGMGGEEAAGTGDPFVDVDRESSLYPYIMAARELGIVQGTSTEENTFEPNKPVSRQDAALMLSRAYTELGGEIPGGLTAAFADSGRIADYARDAVAFMSDRGIINGVGGGRFDPTGNTSVEQALKIALEMLDKLSV